MIGLQETMGRASVKQPWPPGKGGRQSFLLREVKIKDFLCAQVKRCAGYDFSRAVNNDTDVDLQLLQIGYGQLVADECGL
jgi:hypothetical protein